MTARRLASALEVASGACVELGPGADGGSYVVGVDELEPWFREQLLVAEPEGRGPRRIQALEVPIEPRDAEQVERHVEELVEIVLRLVSRLHVVVDVGGDADPSRDVTVRVAERFDARDKPPETPVVAPQRELELERRPRADGVVPPSRDRTEHLGSDDLLPARALHLFERRAGVLVPAAVEEIDRPVRLCGPAELRHRVEDRRQLGLGAPLLPEA